jgi:hypothetical protein
MFINKLDDEYIQLNRCRNFIRQGISKLSLLIDREKKLSKRIIKSIQQSRGMNSQTVKRFRIRQIKQIANHLVLQINQTSIPRKIILKYTSKLKYYKSEFIIFFSFYKLLFLLIFRIGSKRKLAAPMKYKLNIHDQVLTLPSPQLPPIQLLELQQQAPRPPTPRPSTPWPQTPRPPTPRPQTLSLQPLSQMFVSDLINGKWISDK